MKIRGLAPKLPLTRDYEDGFSLIKNHVDMVRQNVKMILLTAPGERIMDPEFGVGLMTYLFENNSRQTQNAIDSKIREQLEAYMPYVEIMEISFDNTDTNPEISENYLNISMKYYIEPLEEVDVIDLDFDLSKRLLINER